MLFALWAIAGWCGTPYPGWWKRPPPPPDPWWLVKIASLVGGIAGGWMTQQVIGPAEVGGIAVLTTLFGAFVTGGFLGGVVGGFAGGQRGG